MSGLTRFNATMFGESYDMKVTMAASDFDALMNRCLGADQEFAAMRKALTEIRDSTFRNATTLRAMADRALSK